MTWHAQWIKPANDMGAVAPLYTKTFSLGQNVESATLSITALGVYEARLNGRRIGAFMLAPGWTSYQKRLQYQSYDVSALLKADNTLSVTVGKGWYRSRMPGWQESAVQNELRQSPPGMLAQLDILYTDGRSERIVTDGSWTAGESRVRFSEIYDGETYDASFDAGAGQTAAVAFDGPFDRLVAQQGEEIREMERVLPKQLFTTPNGEVVVDFGQIVTGYAEISVEARKGDTVELSHAEVMDRDGNFYTENYRSAKAKYRYICKDGRQTCKPKHTFFGFRYIRVDAFPGGAANAAPANFAAIAVYSNIRRTGTLVSSSGALNQLFDNILWGQKGNFLDVPTDCPQRDERLGWTGDAQVFVKAAALNFDVETFFTKWLADLAADQGADGRVGHVIPDILGDESSAAWGDAAAICPWAIYMAYGNPDILSRQFTSMKRWIAYITEQTNDPYLWTGGTHFGDWLGLDAPSGSYKGSTREDFIASAFYAHSTQLVIKAGRVLGEDVSEYETLHQQIVDAFQKAFPVYTTQTECVLAAHFHLAPDCQKAADQLAGMVKDAGMQLRTGFVGTPYLLHVLSAYGYCAMAYSLLLREAYPSWLYPVTKGATTIWEHWDGIMEDGGFWSKDMNSFNHYAYGAVADWVYGVAAGIVQDEAHPGYAKVTIAPHPDKRLDWLKAALETRRGLIRSEWKQSGGMWRYEIETPVDAVIVIDGISYPAAKGMHTFYSAL